MKHFLFVTLFIYCTSLQAKEWRSLRYYQKTTKLHLLSASDWLKKDRKRNTNVWQNANRYNLKNNLPEDYTTIKQRRDFYAWYYFEITNAGHQVVWPSMAHFITSKLRLLCAFPLSIFTSKDVKEYALKGSEDVFNQSFIRLNNLLQNPKILTDTKAKKWDEIVVHLEQFVWLEAIYKYMPDSSLKTIESMAKGKFLYSIAVPKDVKFVGSIKSAMDRYEYAINILKPYCETQHEIN